MPSQKKKGCLNRQPRITCETSLASRRRNPAYFASRINGLVASNFFAFFKGFFAMVFPPDLRPRFRSRGLSKLYANQPPMSTKRRLPPAHRPAERPLGSAISRTPNPGARKKKGPPSNGSPEIAPKKPLALRPRSLSSRSALSGPGASTAWSLPTSWPSSRVSLPWYFLRTCFPVSISGFRRVTCKYLANLHHNPPSRLSPCESSRRTLFRRRRSRPPR